VGSPSRTARTDLLREVLDVAIAVGRRVEADDRAAVPAPLRPVLGLTRIGSRARAAADRAGDDDAFRALVAEAVDADDLDDAGRLWLTRPEGWEQDLDGLVRRQVAEADEADARKALDRERRARRKAEAERDALRADVDRLTAELADLAAVRARAEDAEARAEALADERAAAVRQLKDLEAVHQRAHEELRTLRADLADARAQTPEPASPAEPVIRSGGKPPDLITGSGSGAQDAAAVAEAARAAGELAAALDALAARLRPDGPDDDHGDRTDGDDPPRPRHRRRTPRPRPARRPPALPGGVHDDSPEAAAHLVRLPGAALLVDGYNATMSTWPGRDLPEQRRRLVDALDQLEARVGVQATVVFDGVEETLRRSASRRVDVRFTPAGVEADDVILDLVDALPGDRPVVVASDDQRVRTGARQRGAHPIGTDQLRSLL
jgi:hypothetical protein